MTAFTLWTWLACSKDEDDQARHSSSVVPDGQDVDGDGFAAEWDCDDGDADRYLGAPDPPGDGVDGDCDGGDGIGLPLASHAVVAVPPPVDSSRVSLRYGHVVTIGDQLGDATAEVVVGSYDQEVGLQYSLVPGDGGVWVLDGADLTLVSSAYGDLFGGAGMLGTSVVIDDLGGGPEPDLLTRTSNYVMVAIDGAPDRLGDLVEVGPREASTTVVSGDLSGDGVPDVVWDTSDPSTVKVWFGPILEPRAVADHVVDASDFGGLDSTIAVGDWSGDGQADLLVALPLFDDFRGRLLGIRGPIAPGTSALTDAEWVVDGPATSDWFGESVGPVADLDGDGAVEVLVGSLGWPGEGVFGGTRHGRVYGLPGGGSLEDAPYRIESDGGVAELLGRSIAVGDLDGDGITDLAVGAPGMAYRDADWLPGRVLVFFGPIVGTRYASDADVVFVGDQPGGGAGWSLAIGDTTGDGIDDLVVGAPFRDSEDALDNGAVYLVAGPLR